MNVYPRLARLERAAQAQAASTCRRCGGRRREGRPVLAVPGKATPTTPCTDCGAPTLAGQATGLLLACGR